MHMHAPYFPNSSLFKVFTGSEEENLKLGQTPELLSFAAFTGEAVTIPVNEPSQNSLVCTMEG